MDTDHRGQPVADVGPLAIDRENGDISAVMRFLTHAAPAAIAEHVQELWLLDDDGSFHAGLPKPYVELVISLSGVHWWRAARGAAEHRYTDAWVTPLQHGARYARAVGRRRLIGARLQPWSAMALFGPLPSGDGTPPPRLASLIGSDAAQLRGRLRQAKGDADRFALLGQWLADRLQLIGRHPHLPRAVRPIARASRLAQLVEAHPRSLRRHFARDIGLSPKQWLKLCRLDSVLRDAALRDSAQPLAAVALDHGFADQAHLARDIARLASTTPTALRRRGPEMPPHLLPNA